METNTNKNYNTVIVYFKIINATVNIAKCRNVYQ